MTYSTLQTLDPMHTTLLTILYIFVKESFVLKCEGHAVMQL